MSLRFPWDTPPATTTTDAEIRSITATLQWVRMPLPFALNHVNVWLLEDGDATFIVDTALHSRTTIALWQSVLSQLERPLSGLLVTHYHPDHAGLAGWFAHRHTMPIWFSRQEWAVANEAWIAVDKRFAADQDHWYSQHGLDPQRRAVMAQAGNSYRPLVHELPAAPSFVANGDFLNIGGHAWEVITVGGHSPEMICLYSADENILIAADQILPSITPNVSLAFYTRDLDPMGSFLSSIERFNRVSDDVLVLPSHGLPFRGLHERISSLIAHHTERFELLVERCRTPQTATDMLPVLFKRSLDSQQLMFAIGESVAHLRHLATAGRLESVVLDDVEHFVVR